MITGFYAALLTLGLIKLIFGVVSIRRSQKISLSEGEHLDPLNRAIRAHGNFIETVPFALILMALIEAQFPNPYLLHALGIALIAGRFLHARSIIKDDGAAGKFRFYGMVTTINVYIVSALTLVILYLNEMLQLW